MTTAGSADPLAVALAAVAACLVGLAAVRQHGVVIGVVDGSVSRGSAGLRHLVRQPAWLLGGLQAGVAAGLHGLALALAPIALVQPVGVLAVPVTVIATAIRRGAAPSPRQVIGSLLGVGGLAGLTLLLLRPDGDAGVTVPTATTVALVTIALTAGAPLLARATRRVGARARCVLLAVVAAVLFGFTSVVVRTAGQVLTSGRPITDWPLLVVAAVGVAACAAVGMWAVQTAYCAGSPHVVICCLTLVDPVTALVGGRLLLHETVRLTAPTLLAAVGCALVAALGVGVLSSAYPVSASRTGIDPTKISSTSTDQTMIHQTNINRTMINRTMIKNVIKNVTREERR